jgi:hypothetical protein
LQGVIVSSVRNLARESDMRAEGLEIWSKSGGEETSFQRR